MLLAIDPWKIVCSLAGVTTNLPQFTVQPAPIQLPNAVFTNKSPPFANKIQFINERALILVKVAVVLVKSAFGGWIGASL